MKKIALLIVCLGFIPAVFWAAQDPASSKEEKEEVKPSVPDLLKREQEGEPLTTEMHFILGLDAYDRGDMEEAARRFGISASKGKGSEAYNKWGLALSDLAEMKGDEALFRESFDKFAEAVRLEPDDHEAYYNWGVALVNLAMMKEDEVLLRESFTKFAEDVRLNPDYHHA
ncbi:MAG: hypothetical protein JSV08_02760 [Acidobacteriota bacterium]|nr:MAG: hypothetical protein JSV08_02760 [Acidobacteriota bacterium]